MKILLTGASGFIGQHLARMLTRSGHCVIPVSRSHGIDFNCMLAADDWLPYLQGIDVVINSTGIIAETREQTFGVLHHKSPAALFRACYRAGVRRVIQISALGADQQVFSPYHTSKGAADDVLRGLALDWFILRPSLVYGEGGSSFKLFQRLAGLPLMPLVGDGGQPVQPVHVSDVVATVMRCLHAAPAQRTLDVVGPCPLTFVEWLQTLRHKQGKKPTFNLPAPERLVMAFAYLLHGFMPLLQPDNLRMLQHGSVAEVQPLAGFLGRMPLSVEEAL